MYVFKLVLAAFLLLPMWSTPALAQERTENAGENRPSERTDKNTLLVMVTQAPNRLRPGASYSSGYGSALTQTVRERLGREIAGEYGFEFVELWPMPVLGLDCLVIRFTEDFTEDQAVQMLEKHPSVEWAEPIATYQTLAQRRGGNADPLASLSPATNSWNLERVHSSWTGRNVQIAVIDTQIDAGHPDLAGRIRLSRNFAPQSPARPEDHGTEVAGIIAANARNGIGIAGIAPEARLLALRACWQTGDARGSQCTSLNLARAINYAIERRANIINLSLGGPPNRLLSRLIDTASERGIAVVAAHNRDLPRGGFPASHSKVIAVSQKGVSIGRGYVAPGMDIPTTQPGGGWTFVTGSSYSAAHISGLLALNYERNRKGRGPWRSLVRMGPSSREIDIPATFR
ncbi:MAG: S8 family serine peptidase [Pseudomonadota bacterium]